MRYLTLFLLLFALDPIRLSAQRPDPPPGTLAAMARLKFMSGSWKGTGWMEFAPGNRQSFESTEQVDLKLDGLLLLVEGIHHVNLPGNPQGMKVHHALATITYDPGRRDYQVRATKANGEQVEARGRMTDGAFVWGFHDPRLGHLRFTIRLKDGKWHETGERSADGSTWTRYIEMNLTKS